jgi:hypothetical protein
MDPVSIALALSQFAPSILRFFGVGEKPIGVAEKVIDMATALTGTKSPQEALEALKRSEGLAHEFSMAMLQNDAVLEQLYFADRKDARARDVAIVQATGHMNSRASVMLAMAFIAVVVIATLLALGSVDAASSVGGFLITIGGMFARNIGTAFDFEFGSSRGSKDKDDLLSQLAKGGAK